MIDECSYGDGVRAEHITLERDGSLLPAYLAVPLAARATTPSIVLAMHLSGVDADQRQWARRFAAGGFATIVPDLYARFGAPDGDVERDPYAFMPFAKQLTFEGVEPDIQAAAAYLRDAFPQTRTAIAGFCMGGVMAVRRAHGYAAQFCAAAVWYGRVEDIDAATVDVPIVASFGAADAGIPVEGVRRFAAGLTVPNDVKIYDGAAHAFCDSRGTAYDASASEDAWLRTLAFLRTAAQS